MNSESKSTAPTSPPSLQKPPPPSNIDNNNEFDLASYLTLTNLIIFAVFLLVLYVILGKVGSSGEEELGETLNVPQSSPTAGIFMIILAVAVFFAAYKLYQSFNITTDLEGEGSKDVTLNVNIDKLTPDFSNQQKFNPSFGKEVFNIPGNYYTYEQSKAVCEAYDADLATYDQVEKAYNAGGEWCNYGWSEGQMALFPTQQASYDKLQKIEGHEHDCGRPGVNGGYIANPNVKFGVNCYGKKPAQTQYESDLMKTQKGYPINEKDILFQKQVDYWKNKINDLLVSPFNYNSWSKI
jgi:hypothetical protein